MQAQVLVVEDETLLQKHILRSLQRAGFLATGATCLSEARQILQLADIHAILLDVALPDGDGLEFLQQVHAWKPHLYVVIVTAQDSPAVQQRASQLGAAGFLKKPVALKSIHDALLAGGILPQPGEAVTPS